MLLLHLGKGIDGASAPWNDQRGPDDLQPAGDGSKATVMHTDFNFCLAVKLNHVQ